MSQGAQLSSEEIKQVLFEDLEIFDRFCDEHQLKYWLVYGTALGAIRHQGFIPWDDDLDIAMPDSEWKRLVSIASDNDGYIAEHLRLVSPELNPSIYTPFGKIVDTRTVAVEDVLRDDAIDGAIGLWIDVFRYTGRPESTVKRHVIDFIYSGAHAFLKLSTWKLRPGESKWGTTARYLLVMPARLLGPSRINRFMLWFENKVLPLYGSTREVYTPTNKKLYWPKEYFSQLVRVPFESGYFPVPAHFDEVLRRQYDDYMTPPPQQDRRGHGMRVYWTQAPNNQT
ncbi:MAG: LicD family protein [Actinomycetaceae bacterium]|nr:LicD family protein [Actinomycetaceae bacterium]